MGSTGSGSFSDYPGSRPKDGGDGAGGGTSGEDRCARAFACALEEIELCDYFAANNNVPPVGSELSIERRGRLVAVDSSGLTVGALPTRFNYLADCLGAGFSYAGRITASVSTPVASVNADSAPSAP